MDARLERIGFFAKALAYGALADLWPPTFKVIALNSDPNRIRTNESWEVGGKPNRLKEYLKARWDSQHPQAGLLESFEYLRRLGGEDREIKYILTPKAYALLERPTVPPKVFISYCHKTSSAFALMLEYRLEAMGIPVFIDRSIPSGDDWHERLQKTVENCEYFVCLITTQALKSEFVQREIMWAAGQHRILIWQPSFDSNATVESCPEWLDKFVKGKQAIRIPEESTEAYHNAVEKLLNELGFALP